MKFDMFLVLTVLLLLLSWYILESGAALNELGLIPLDFKINKIFMPDKYKLKNQSRVNFFSSFFGCTWIKFSFFFDYQNRHNVKFLIRKKFFFKYLRKLADRKEKFNLELFVLFTFILKQVFRLKM